MTTEPSCTHPDTWFDRSVCAEPCGSMHCRCTGCGVVVGQPCPIEGALAEACANETQAEVYFAARPSEERLLHVLEAGDGPNLGQPGYEIRRSDLKEVLDDLRWARDKLLVEQEAHEATMERLEALERDEEKLWEDLEDLQNQREDWKTEKARLERELVYARTDPADGAF